MLDLRRSARVLRPLRAGGTTCRSRCASGRRSSSAPLTHARAGSRRADRPSAASTTIAADSASWPVPAVELEATLPGPSTEDWDPEADLLGSDGDDARASSSRPSTTAPATLRFGDDVHGRRPDDRDRVRGDLPRRQRRGRQRRRRRDRPRGDDPGAASSGVANPLPAAGGTEPEPADAVRRDAPEAFLVQERAVTAGRLRRGDRAQRRGAARGGDVPLDGLVAHRVRHRRPLRRAAGRRGVRGRRPASPRAVPHGRLRPRGRRAAVRAARDRAARLRRREYFRSHVRRPCSTCSRAARAPTERSGFFHPDRFTLRPAGLPVGGRRGGRSRSPGVESVTALRFQRQRDDSSRRARHRRAADGPARDRPARRRSQLPRARRARPDLRRRQVSGRRPTPAAAAAGSASARRSRFETGPGSRVIAYRIGTHADFLASMIAGLTDAERPALAALATRDTDDFTIALLDAWAVVADVLTFYTERLAQESYPAHGPGAHLAAGARPADRLPAPAGRRGRDPPGVRARARRPRFRPQARPRPGLRSAGDPGAVTLEAGLRVQSIPGPGEQPQTFETVEEIEARPEWNALPASNDGLVLPRPRRHRGVPRGLDAEPEARRRVPVRRRRRARRALGPADPHDRRSGCRRRSHTRHLGRAARLVRSLRLPAGTPQAFVLRKRINVFGHNAPVWNSMSAEFRADYPGSMSSIRAEWPNFDDLATSMARRCDLDGVAPGRRRRSWVVLSRPSYRELWQVEAVAELARAEFAISGKVTRLTLDGRRELRAVPGRRSRDDRVRRQRAAGRSPRRRTTPTSRAASIDVDADVAGMRPGRRAARPRRDGGRRGPRRGGDPRRGAADRGRLDAWLLEDELAAGVRARDRRRARQRRARHPRRDRQRAARLGAGAAPPSSASRSRRAAHLRPVDRPLRRRLRARGAGQRRALGRGADALRRRAERPRVRRPHRRAGQDLRPVRRRRTRRPPAVGLEQRAARYRKGLGAAGNVKRRRARASSSTGRSGSRA